jgi:cbb3-type cytochrome oxidase maturation protein
MNILLMLIPLSLMLLMLAIAAFVWAVRSGQFEGLEVASLAALEEDDAFESRSTLTGAGRDDS